jgi:hypothetical protein
MGPTNSLCHFCGKTIRGGFAGFSFGAVADTDLLEKHKLTDEILDGFCYVHFHGSDPEMLDSACYMIAKDVPGGQQDIDFCSLTCLRSWLCGIVDKLESDLAWQQQHGRLLPEIENRTK